jgi:hypothetical protein
MSLRISQENGKKGSEGCARFLPGEARRNALFTAVALSAFGTCKGAVGQGGMKMMSIH